MLQPLSSTYVLFQNSVALARVRTKGPEGQRATVWATVLWTEDIWTQWMLTPHNSFYFTLFCDDPSFCTQHVYPCNLPGLHFWRFASVSQSLSHPPMFPANQTIPRSDSHFWLQFKPLLSHKTHHCLRFVWSPNSLRTRF